MIALTSVFQRFKTDFEMRYADRILPSHHKALNAMMDCRSRHSPRLKMACSECDEVAFVPHSCGHRHCPHCQAFESQRWLEQQQRTRTSIKYSILD